MKKPELLIPAGNLEKLKIACLYGADAVFLGGQEYGLRSNSQNFSLEEITQGCAFAKEHGVDVYVTTNIYAHEENLVGFSDFVKHLEQSGVRGIIVSDPAYIKICREVAPSLEIHISTQQSITNTLSVKMFESLGVDRVVLARELSFSEIKEIASNTATEIEIFIHGAVCSSYSGRCTLSNHMTSRDSNRGGCCQSCRWDYQLVQKSGDNYTPVVTDPDFAFNMSAKDMNVINHLPQILELGVDSLKVEGRMKTYHYVASVTKVYREAIDAYFNDPQNFKVEQKWIDELAKTESRLSYIGALNEDMGSDGMIYQNQYQPSTGYDFVGMVIDSTPEYMIIEQRNLFTTDDQLECLCYDRENVELKVDKFFTLEGEEITRANHPLMKVKINSDLNLPPYTIIRKVIN